MIVSSSWGVIVAQRNCCAAVASSLNQLGIDHFIPKEEILSIVRGRRIRAIRPLFGDYILTSISSTWKSLLSIKHVAGMLLNESGMPAQVLPREMERIREFCLSTRETNNYELQYGQKVTPTEGPFLKFVGRYDGKTKRGDDTALFLLFGREQRVTFKSGDLLGL